jgi:hypothetical protein
MVRVPESTRPGAEVRSVSMRRTRAVGIALLVVVSPLAGLAFSAGPGAGVDQPNQDPAAALAKAETLWRERRPATYEFTLAVQCFCPGLLKEPPSFRVTGGEAKALEPLRPLSERVYGTYNNVEKLFAAIRHAMSFGQYRIAVTYNDKLGYPVAASLDPRREVADEELSFRVWDFRSVGDELAPPQLMGATSAQLSGDDLNQIVALAQAAGGRPWSILARSPFGLFRPARMRSGLSDEASLSHPRIVEIKNGDQVHLMLVADYKNRP